MLFLPFTLNLLSGFCCAPRLRVGMMYTFTGLRHTLQRKAAEFVGILLMTSYPIVLKPVCQTALDCPEFAMLELLPVDIDNLQVGRT
ncbi:MAG: hypothetical protein ACI8P9_003514 [Parasphingorhabdus sp.]|jgi:hypothetical protein